MATIVKSDIFFFITSISVIILTLVMIIGGFYLIKILKNFSDMSHTLKEAVDDTNIKFQNIKKKIGDNRFFSFIFGKLKNKKKKHNTKS